MLQTSLRGGVAGAVATAVMTLEQPLDKRLFDSKYDDVEILGKLVTRGDDWQPIGFALHVQNGAILGAAYARLKPSLPGAGGPPRPGGGPHRARLDLADGRAGRPLPPCPQGAAEARRQPPGLRPSDDPPRSVRDRPRAPRGRPERPCQP